MFPLLIIRMIIKKTETYGKNYSIKNINMLKKNMHPHTYTIYINTYNTIIDYVINVFCFDAKLRM